MRPTPENSTEFVKGEQKMFGPIEVLIIKASPEMIHNWGWFLAFGIVLLSLGIAAIVRSVSATVASMVFFGWLLLFSSIIEFADAFLVGKWAGFFLHLLIAILFGVAGVIMLSKPVISAEAVTYLMAMFFLIAGIYQLVASMWTHLPGWGWQALNGIIASVMGGLVLAEWPVSGLWVIGLFVGIDLVFAGWSWVALALDLHKM
jgi:uncharacterized membrane protein HdeD (DUF308 family)